MATSFTLHAIDRFPAGTSVGAYPASGFSGQPSGAPTVSASETQTMGATGTEFTSLDPGHYFFGASVSGTWRYVGATVGSEDTETGEYTGSDSYQPASNDLEVAAAAGAGAGDSAFLAAYMGNILGDTLTKTNNYLAGVLGALSILGARASELQIGAVVGIVMDGVSTGDAAVVAVIDGSDPSAVTRVTAAFAARQNNNNAGSGVDYGVDLYDAGRSSGVLSGGGLPLAISKADLRLSNEVCVQQKAGAPTNGTSGDGVGYAGPGSLLIDRTNKKLYINTNTKASPTWTVVGTQS